MKLLKISKVTLNVFR